ncbi:pilus assembly protein TadG-related protein [Micromonospora sp. NPDC050397]|uniref:pilus assembly protein TadG-related protein n=1 Tax=Micromonospora sp. NPDC050397 TaxID=3364279 RepID=UPI00384FBEE9
MNGDHRDAGRVSLFLAVAMLGIFAVIGMSYDGAGQLRALQRADNLAAEAARAGGQEIDRAAAIGGGGIVLDEAAAYARINAYVNDAQATLVAVDFNAFAGGQDVTVTVSVQYDRYMLDFLGFSNSIDVEGRATALLRTEP